MRAVLIAAACLLAAAPAAAAPVANESRGAEVYESCAACHGDKGVGTDSGPALAGVVGRKAASADGFRYSPAMKRSGITWDAAALSEFLADPQGKVKGNRMPFDGIADKADRDALVAYLQGLE
ncbi:c-type cytochrome [Skermanella mucosa]|uniref:c-type cytochrome n=1 Tax=Skermanella mucosa TaxID=1789672 RepID=UPI00192B8241|nr:c-type cytochrome [Skermanella mucosa]UEM20894.1 c-type cytochrome [Skermanella mucosa]